MGSTPLQTGQFKIDSWLLTFQEFNQQDEVYANLANKTQMSQSGVVTRRLWGSRPSNAAVEFNNITDANTSEISMLTFAKAL